MNTSSKENENTNFTQDLLQLSPEPTDVVVINSSFMPNQKRTLLFNVQRPFEVPMNEFDAEYTRKEDVPSEKRRKTKVREAEDSEKLKHFQAVWVLVKKEAVKNYLAPVIVSVVKEEVANIKYKVCGPQNTYLTSAPKLAQDIRDATSFLEKEGYQGKLFRIHHQSTCGFVFAHSKQLENLQRYGCWNVSGHFFVSNEDNQSSVETRSIMATFPGLKKETWNKMIQAIHKQMKIGCEFFIQKLINECTLFPLKNTSQVTLTNALESYHSELKRTLVSYYGLIGACDKIVALDLKKRSDSDYVAFEFQVKKISAPDIDNDILKKIHKFSFPIQKLIV
ncbi:7255_t:CDS:2, partial [Gigaspora margarita]